MTRLVYKHKLVEADYRGKFDKIMSKALNEIIKDGGEIINVSHAYQAPSGSLWKYSTLIVYRQKCCKHDCEAHNDDT